jgi:hypothetical protein
VSCETLTGLYHSGYTPTQLSKPALLAEPAPPIGSFITPPLAGWDLPANSYVSLDLLKLASAELALEAEGTAAGARDVLPDTLRPAVKPPAVLHCMRCPCGVMCTAAAHACLARACSLEGGTAEVWRGWRRE